jgi:Glu-tRNA(Gln) amidotransferase subunit E-like FAD-binding protein
VCDARTTFDMSKTPQTDWEEKVQEQQQQQQTEAPDETVVAWRVHRFMQLGLDYGVAIRVAQTSVDLHEFERLVSTGASPETAARILE